MDKFIHRENLTLFRKRLADARLTEAQRKVILILLAEEQAKHCDRPAPTTDQDDQRAIHRFNGDRTAIFLK
jgi:hypothetical protein